MKPFSITFWGVRGSYPAPGPKTAGVGGNTPCVEVCAGQHPLIFDAGTGIIGLGHEMANRYRVSKQPITATLFFTHTHHDHTQGFPFFVPARFQLTNLYIFGPKSLHQDLEEVLSRSMLPPVFPITLDELPCLRVVANLKEGQAVILNSADLTPRVVEIEREVDKIRAEDVVIRVMRSYAHPAGVFTYRVEWDGRAFVFATDTEGYVGDDARLVKFARGADLLVHDAQYTEAEYAHPDSSRQGWGHSTWNMAVAVAQAAQVKRLALFHHEPDHDDATLAQIERDAQALFPAAFVAREGMTVEL
jgi:phosphoribosyl 1,2-cyclic phosphodiesterase